MKKVFTRKGIEVGNAYFEYSAHEKSLSVTLEDESLTMFDRIKVEMDKKELAELIRGLVTIYKSV